MDLFFYFPSHFSNVKVKHTFQVDSAGQIKISIQLFRFLSVSKKLNFLFALSNFRMRCHVSEWIVSEYCAGKPGARKSGVSSDDATSAN